MGERLQVATPVLEPLRGGQRQHRVDQLDREQEHADNTAEELPEPVVGTQELQEMGLARYPWVHPDVVVTVVVEPDRQDDCLLLTTLAT